MSRCALIWFYLASALITHALPESHNRSFSEGGLYKKDVTFGRDPDLVAQPDVPLTAHRTVLWCGTLQLAWNEVIQLVGEKLEFDRQAPEVDLLNREDFTRQNLASGSYVALADFERNHVEDQIRAALEKKFQGAASPELIPPVPRHPGPDDFVAYAYLYKNLAFATPFVDLAGLRFGGQAVESFGSSAAAKAPANALAQVVIDDYLSPSNFIIELKTKASDDQLILAKIPPGTTLGATSQSVLNRMTHAAPERFEPGDTLNVPKLNFDLRKDFIELEGLILQPNAQAKIKSKLVLSKVRQLVRFQLNEKGAVLKSEAVLAFKTLAIRSGHQLIFDQPFLLLLKKKNSAKPYFAVWVGDATLLVPAAKNDEARH